MSKEYFKNSFISGLKTMVFIFIIGLLCYPLIIALTPYSLLHRNQNCNVGYAIFFLGVLCYVIPIIKNAYLMKKKTIDCYYSLPIKRTTLMNTNLVIGFLQIIIPYTLVYFLGFFIMLTKSQRFVMSYYIPLFFVSIIIAFGVYVFNYFVATRANSVIDSIIFIVLYTFIIAAIIGTIYSARDYFREGYVYIEPWFKNTWFDPIECVTFAPLVNIGNHYSRLINDSEYIDALLCTAEKIFVYGYSIGLGIIGYVGLLYFTKKDCSERCEQVSSSWFGYRVLIPVYLVLMEMMFAFENTSSSISYIIIIIMSLIGYVIYHRKFRIPKSSLITFGACVVASIILILIIK